MFEKKPLEEKASMSKSHREPCKYYTKGFCSNHPCKHWHDPSIASTPCKFFVAGDCKHGDKCAYYHEGAKDSLNETDEVRESRAVAACTIPEPDDDAEVCRYDPNCYRLNPDHLRKFRHPSREKLPPKPTLAKGATSSYNWDAIAKALPTDRTPAMADERKKLFKTMDFNGNGLISLAEVDKCIIESLGMGDVFPKKVMLRAFFFANSVAPNNGTLTDDMVTMSEFRVLLCALRRYLQCFEVFDNIDSQIERDGRINTAELEKSIPMLKDLGLPAGAIDKFVASTNEKPMKVLACSTGAQNHMVLFEEFCNKYGLRHDLNCQPGDGFGGMFHGARHVKRWGEY